PPEIRWEEKPYEPAPPPQEPGELLSSEWPEPLDLPAPESNGDVEELDPLDEVKLPPLLDSAPDQVGKLLEYLGDLSQYLPPVLKERLFADDLPLKMEKLRLTLAQGDQGPPETPPDPPEKVSFWPVKGEAPAVTKEKLKKIMTKLKGKLEQ
ncbi:MAG: hypothetical protein HKM06_05945, partial [Spirochaetales bacterium]|nr:hypothetical protein [Spirochaetales bacterium]